MSAHASALQISSKPIAAAWEPIHFWVSGWEGGQLDSAIGIPLFGKQLKAQSNFGFLCFFSSKVLNIRIVCSFVIADCLDLTNVVIILLLRSCWRVSMTVPESHGLRCRAVHRW